MALTGKLDLTTTPATLTVVSDRRKESVTVHSAGEDLTLDGVWPVTVTDSAGRTWTLKSDDGATAVYTG